MNTYLLMPSDKKDKKFMVITPDGRKQIHFGLKGASDMTQHQNPSRRALYIKRHSGMGENWNKSGIKTRGFWSRWLLWSEPTIEKAIKLIEKKFNIDIYYVPK